MNSLKHLLLLAGLALATIVSGQAQNVQHLSITKPGGMPGIAQITGKILSSNSMTVTWDGPAGYYTLLERPNATAAWVTLTTTNLNRRATISLRYSNALFAVTGPKPIYAGAQACLGCHKTLSNSAAHTQHGSAFTDPAFVAKGGQSNPSCLPCHSVGYGVPTGFVSKTATPKLMGVQCENCHGPAANHAASPMNVAVRPRAEMAATVCGGCHTANYHEWASSAHSIVQNVNTAAKINACGRCHSGTVRASLLNGATTLPAGDANMGIVCNTCHDPHQTNAYVAQLRNPMFSTNDYTLSTNDVFATKYNKKINLCAQCHNRGGDSWKDTLSPPHLSPQYNIMLGTVGELTNGLAHYQPSTHALKITDQCVGCHMAKETIPIASQVSVSAHNHSFEVTSFTLCVKCHGTQGTNLIAFAQREMLNNIRDIKSELDYWATSATNTATASLRTKYGVRAWEYTTPGALSSGGPGPTTAEQALIPNNIKKARFNLYLVLNDGSSGTHNPYYCIDLLDAAEAFIRKELGL